MEFGCPASWHSGLLEASASQESTGNPNTSVTAKRSFVSKEAQAEPESRRLLARLGSPYLSAGVQRGQELLGLGRSFRLWKLGQDFLAIAAGFLPGVLIFGVGSGNSQLGCRQFLGAGLWGRDGG